MKIEGIRTLLPDYAAGMLSDDERRAVEDALESSPELRAELDRIRTLFDAFPPQRIQRELDWQTRMLSVRIVEKLPGIRNPKRIRWQWFAVSVACTAAIVAAIVFPERNHRQQEYPTVMQPTLRTSSVQLIAGEESRTQRSNVPTPRQSALTQPVRTTSGIHQQPIIESAPVDAITIPLFPYDEIDSDFVERFAEVFSDETLQ